MAAPLPAILLCLLSQAASYLFKPTPTFRRSYGNCTDRSADEGGGRPGEAAEHAAQRDRRHRAAGRGAARGAVPRLVQPERPFVGRGGRVGRAPLDGAA